MRRSELHPNPKTRGLVSKFLDLGRTPIDSERILNLGPNLFVEKGRNMAAGLLVGATGGYAQPGYAEADGWVIRGMALGNNGEPESDGDTALGGAWTNAALSPEYYHPIDPVSGIEFDPVASNTKVTFIRTFTSGEPQNASLDIREYGLYTANHDGTVPTLAGGPFLVARKTHGLITKTTDFTMTVKWTIEY
jgi:hypothetical protein